MDKETAKIELTDTNLKFKGKSGEKEYELELEFVKANGGIDAAAEDSKYAVKPRSVQFLLMKKEEGFWPRLLEDKQLQKTNVKVDFSRYCDSDEEEEAGGFDAAGMDALGGAMGGMGGMGGMPGMGGMGGMPGMGGPGGGMDMEALQKMMAQMGGGAGGMPDLSAMGAGDAPGDDGDDEGDSDDDLPELE